MTPEPDLNGYQRLAIAVIAAGMRDALEAPRFLDSVAFRYWSLVAGLDPMALRREYLRRRSIPGLEPAGVDT